MSDVLRASGESNGGALWLQRVPGQAPEYVGCADLDDITEPKGDVTLSMCRDAKGKFQTVGRARGIPGGVTGSFTAWVFPEKSILDDIMASACPVVLYALSRVCGSANVFDNYVRGLIPINATITNVAHSNVVKRADTGEQAVKIDFTADFPLSRVRAVKVTQQDIAETTDLLDVAFCDSEECAGACSGGNDAGESGFVVGAAPAGSPGADADVWGTVTGGAAWTNETPYSVHPFGAGYDIASATCFDVSGGATRKLVARDIVGGQPAQVAYSDDDWVTRTQVTVGATNGEGAVGQGALFALDLYHIWFATNEGNVYFSATGGASWSLLPSVTASGGNPLNAIRFADPDHGYAVGDAGAIIETTDGGDSWAALVDPTGGDDITAVAVFSQFRFIIGTGVGGFWQSWDEGDNFTEQSGYTGYVATNEVRDIGFFNDVVGYAIVNTKVYRTINGGNDWKLLTTPTNAGLNALAVINENLAYAVGNASGGSGVVLKISG